MRKRLLFYFLGFLSAISSSLMTALDVYVSSELIPNPWVYGLSSFIVGTIFSWLLLLILSFRFDGFIPARFIDPNFRRFRLISLPELPYHLLAGLGNATSTAGYFLVVYLTRDPASVLAFTQLVVIYLIIGEQLIEKDSPTIVEVQALSMVVIGGIISSIKPTGEIDYVALSIVLTLINGGKMMQVLAIRKLRTMTHMNLRVDSINIRLWNLAITTIFFALITSLIDYRLLSESIRVSLNYFPIISLVMSLALVANLAYIRALGIGKSSVVQAVTSSSVIFGVPITALLSVLYGDIYTFPSLSGTLFILKLFGAILITLGIASLALSEVRAYILVKVRRGRLKETIKYIWRIKGVEVVSVLAGEYDLLVKVRTRTLGKAYSRILMELEKIENITDFIWMSILREIETI